MIYVSIDTVKKILLQEAEIGLRNVILTGILDPSVIRRVVENGK